MSHNPHNGEKPYRARIISRNVAAPLTAEDAAIFKQLGPGFRCFYGHYDRGDAENIFCRVDSAPARSHNAESSEETPDRGAGC